MDIQLWLFPIAAFAVGVFLRQHIDRRDQFDKLKAERDQLKYMVMDTIVFLRDLRACVGYDAALVDMEDFHRQMINHGLYLQNSIHKIYLK